MYKLSESIQIEEVEEGLCLINEITEKIILLKKVETEVFKLLLTNSVDEVKEIIMNKYYGDGIAKDIEVFTQQLCERNILIT